MKRKDNFEERRKGLAGLSEAELEERFWALTAQIVDPMMELARNSTSPSIERSVLLRMGFSSPEATEIVTRTMEHGMMGKGCGHLVYRLAKEKNLDIREAGLKLAQGEGFADLKACFGGA